MQKTTQRIAGTLIALLALTASAQDAAKVNSKTVTVRLDNAKARVLESALQPGDKEQMHSHPASIIYALSGGVLRNHSADGKTADATLKEGDVVYRDPLTHWAENVGTTTIRVMLIELKPGS